MNISLSEVLLIFIVALLVIKPEQLPRIAFSIGRSAKLLRHLLRQMKDQINTFIDTTDNSTKFKNISSSKNNTINQVSSTDDTSLTR